MASVNVNLSEELKQFVDGQVEAGEFAGADDYIEALIARAKKGKEKLDALLIEGLDSGDSIPLDADEWSRIRSDVEQRLANGNQ
ncbi:MAG: type II toxin-antitoxin system ParD family antitoxin [Planctomycetota bacterium]